MEALLYKVNVQETAKKLMRYYASIRHLQRKRLENNLNELKLHQGH